MKHFNFGAVQVPFRPVRITGCPHVTSRHSLHVTPARDAMLPGGPPVLLKWLTLPNSEHFGGLCAMRFAYPMMPICPVISTVMSIHPLACGTLPASSQRVIDYYSKFMTFRSLLRLNLDQPDAQGLQRQSPAMRCNTSTALVGSMPCHGEGLSRSE